MDRLTDAANKAAFRKAFKHGTSPLTAAAVRNLSGRPNATGWMAEAIGHTVRFYPHSRTAVAVWGVRKGKKYHDRSRLAHLLEFGHRLIAWGRDTDDEVEAKPFLTPAWDEEHRRGFAIAESMLAAEVRRRAAAMGVRFG